MDTVAHNYLLELRRERTSRDIVQWHLDGFARLLLRSLSTDLAYVRDLGMSPDDQILARTALSKIGRVLLEDFDRQVSSGFCRGLTELPRFLDAWLKYVGADYTLAHWNLDRFRYHAWRLARLARKNKRIAATITLDHLETAIQELVILAQQSPATFYQLGTTASELCSLSPLAVLKRYNPGSVQITKVVTATVPLLRLVRREIDALLRLDPEAFEDFIAERLEEMGMEVRKVGSTYSPDGGVDLIATPRGSVFPFLLAVQVKHHRNFATTTGPGPIKDLQTVLATSPFHAGMIVTNTGFTPDAEWWASKMPGKIQLHDIRSIREWVSSRYDATRLRNIPTTIQLTPKVSVNVW